MKTEMMNLGTYEWSDGPDFPYAERNIAFYSTTSTDEAAYIIGGTSSLHQTVAKFSDDAWSNVDCLTKGRYNHGSITVSGQTMIIGGYTVYPPSAGGT